MDQNGTMPDVRHYRRRYEDGRRLVYARENSQWVVTRTVVGGKWEVWHADGTVEQVLLDDAVDRAVTAEDVYLGLPGGSKFDARLVRRWESRRLAYRMTEDPHRER